MKKRLPFACKGCSASATKRGRNSGDAPRTSVPTRPKHRKGRRFNSRDAPRDRASAHQHRGVVDSEKNLKDAPRASDPTCRDLETFDTCATRHAARARVTCAQHSKDASPANDPTRGQHPEARRFQTESRCASDQRRMGNQEGRPFRAKFGGPFTRQRGFCFVWQLLPAGRALRHLKFSNYSLVRDRSMHPRLHDVLIQRTHNNLPSDHYHAVLSSDTSRQPSIRASQRPSITTITPSYAKGTCTEKPSQRFGEKHAANIRGSHCGILYYVRNTS